jgi:hydrogenase expression/formation protein HypC
MCLGIPGRIVSISDIDSKLGLVDVCGVKREVNLACIVDGDHPVAGCVGDWVLVHVGFAMSRIDEHEARLTLALLEELGEAQAEVAALRLAQSALSV